MTDTEFIELLWKCAYWGGELMPPTLPDSNLLREWSAWMEDATVERVRRETLPKTVTATVIDGLDFRDRKSDD
jgi:hypothetical protein